MYRKTLEYKSAIHNLSKGAKDRGRCCIVLLLFQIFNAKMNFNAKLLALRKKKIKLLKEMLPLRREFDEIHELLGTTNPKLQSLQMQLDDDELPEK